MDGPVFDAMLKTALEEALRLDGEEAPKNAKPSVRHRRQMRRMLADPWGYVQPGGVGKRRKRPVRYLAVIAAVVLLTGTAAGIALGRGGRFQEMFNASPWAEVYGGAADTEQLLDMGGELETTVVNANGLRFEMLDAVSDGQIAMVSVRLTVLDKPNQWKVYRQGVDFADIRTVSEAGDEVYTYGWSVSSWKSEPQADLKEGQFSILFTINDPALEEGGRYEIRLKDLLGENHKPLLPGEWTLAVTLRPAKVLELHPELVLPLNGADWSLERLTVSPLAMTMDLLRLDGTWNHDWDFLDTILVRLQDGRTIKDCTMGASGSDSEICLTLEFQMPVDVPQIESVSIGGEEIPLKPEA
jgi:hypothetical protein